MTPHCLHDPSPAAQDLAQRLASLDPDSLNHRLLEDLEEPVTPPSNNKAAKVRL